MEILKKIKNKSNNIDILIAKNLRDRRKQLRLSLKELAEAIDVTTQQIQKYENGTNRIASGNLYYLARILKVPINYFFGLEDKQELSKPELELWIDGKKIPATCGGIIDIKINGKRLKI